MADLERFRRAPGLGWLVQRITRLPDELVQLIDQMRKEILLGPLKRLRQNTARSVYWIQRRHLLSYPVDIVREYLPGGLLFADWERLRQAYANSWEYPDSDYPRWINNYLTRSEDHLALLAQGEYN